MTARTFNLMVDSYMGWLEVAAKVRPMLWQHDACAVKNAANERASMFERNIQRIVWC